MMTSSIQYDLIGVGIGPANLGLAALLEKAQPLRAVFFDENSEFQWHPGMLIEGADLQVPFLADLVTLADPTSTYSFLNYLASQDRLHQFFFFNRFDIPRREYNNYARWAADSLENCLFGKKVIDADYIKEEEPYYRVTVLDQETKTETIYTCRYLVVGTGTKPLIPESLTGYPPEDILHTSQYLYQEKFVLDAERILVVGSGQSAAEIFLEQLQMQRGGRPEIHWFTRSPGFFQLESGKLGQEIFSPDYIDYFHRLPLEKRLEELPSLTQLRNGVEEATLHKIYELLYHRTVGGVEKGAVIQANTEVEDIAQLEDGSYRVTCRQHQEDTVFTVEVDKVILGTGYKPEIPEWFSALTSEALREKDYLKVNRDFSIAFPDDRKENLYSLTDLVHSHGAGATNLALAVHRNVTIINTAADKEIYKDPRNTVFQQFSPPK
jgi:lysine N6-hydroxylase